MLIGLYMPVILTYAINKMLVLNITKMLYEDGNKSNKAFSFKFESLKI